MDLLQIAGCRHESQVRIIQRDGSRANFVSGIPKNCKIPRIESVFEFRAVLFRELGAAISHRPLLLGLLHMKLEARGGWVEGERSSGWVAPEEMI